MRMGKEILYSGYTGYYFSLKHPYSREFDALLGRFLDMGIKQVRVLNKLRKLNLLESPNPRT